jgi:5-methylcytosine-specific restriction protein A
VPSKPLRVCGEAGCPELVHSSERYCSKHKRQRQREYDRQRGSAASRGYGARWRRLRRLVLNRHPLCADPYSMHAERGEVVAAIDVHHVTSKRDGGTDAFDNLQALCHACHSRKTAEETGFAERGRGDRFLRGFV